MATATSGRSRWSRRSRFTLSGAWEVYLKGGVGFYHKVANFTLPGQAFVCYFFCGVYLRANYNFDYYTSNAPGYDVGVGWTYQVVARLACAGSTSEARYVVIANSTAVWHHEYASEPGDDHQ